MTAEEVIHLCGQNRIAHRESSICDITALFTLKAGLLYWAWRTKKQACKTFHPNVGSSIKSLH